MRCTELTWLLGEYADGAADERGRRIVERHIQLCQACRDAVYVTRQLGQQLLRLPLLPLGVAERIPRILRHTEQRMRRSPVTIHPVAARAVWLALIAALSFLLWLLIASLPTMG
jgi:anti-sigma factor RsiW